MTDNSKRILLVGTFLSHAGHNPSYCEALSDRLETRGWTVTRTSSRTNRAARLADMMHTAWQRRAGYSFAVVDVFSGFAFLWAEAVCLELRSLGKPYVLSLRGGRLPDFARIWPRRTRALLRNAAAVIAPSEYLREHMRPYHGDIELLPNALDVGTYRFAPRSSPAVRMVWARAFHSTYNPSLAIDVLARLVTDVPGASLTMIGPDKNDGSREAVERRVRELDLTDRVTLLGRVAKAEMPRHFAAADIFLNTTDVDNTPISVLEAMAAGLCVVSTDVGGLPYLLRNGETALLVPPRDAIAMSDAVKRIVTVPALADRLSSNGRAFAESCDWQPILDHWQRVLERVTR
jgi:glycosyltransferase involved in cell wall biosynthesis